MVVSLDWRPLAGLSRKSLIADQMGRPRGFAAPWPKRRRLGPKGIDSPRREPQDRDLMDETSAPRRAWEVFQAFLIQGLTAFGGQAAQFGLFHREFVERRGWLSEAAYADLVALSQFLPGGAGGQLGMAIGLRRAGGLGLAAAWLGFSLPAGLAAILLAYLAPALAGGWGPGVVHGLEFAAAAVVANAVLGMSRSLAFGPVRGGMAIGAGLGLVIAPGPVAQLLALAAGAALGFALLNDTAEPEPETETAPDAPVAAPMAALAALVLLLGALPFLAAWLDDPALGLASVAYRAGALSFGGDHAILPLLQSEVIGRGWLDTEGFIAGYGAVQALPGPLAAFAGFIGAAQAGWASGLVALLAIALPGALLLVGVLPFWDRLKHLSGARAAVAGVNAVMVGVVAAALWNPLLMAAVRKPSDWALVAGGVIFLGVARLPAWVVVLGMAVLVGAFSG
jgi:chromate transporter